MSKKARKLAKISEKKSFFLFLTIAMSGKGNSSLSRNERKTGFKENKSKRCYFFKLRLMTEDKECKVTASVSTKPRENIALSGKISENSLVYFFINSRVETSVSADDRECEKTHKGKPFRVCLFTRLTLWKVFRGFVRLGKKLTRGFFDDAEPDERNSFDSPELLSMLVINAVAPRNLLRSARASMSSLLSPSSSTKTNCYQTNLLILELINSPSSALRM